MLMDGWVSASDIGLDRLKYHAPVAINVIRSIYLLSSGVILLVRMLPPLRRRFLSYGARNPTRSQSHQGTDMKIRDRSVIVMVLDRLSALDVPHSWFIHFYLLSVTCSVFWLIQLARWSPSLSPSGSEQPLTPALSQLTLQTRANAVFCLCLMLSQGLRRLYECLFVLRTSKSRMWIGHYIFGMTFYFLTNLAVWIESLLDLGSAHPPQAVDSMSPGMHLIIGISLLISAMLVQFWSHKHLANLKKYTLPEQGLFKFLIAPHYTAECVIYASLAFLATSNNFTVNKTVLCALTLVAVNLSITAEGTKQWMLLKFRDREQDILPRCILIPKIW